MIRRALGGILVVLLFALTVPASAAGTGGIEVSPYPGTVNGHQVTAFHTKVPSRGSATVRYSLRNVTAAPVSGRLYAASATPDGKGSYVIGDAGSSPYLTLKTQQMTLTPKQVRLSTFSVHGDLSKRHFAAVVVEVRNGAIVQRAATIVYLEPGRRVPLPLLIILIAFGALALAALGWFAVVRPRR